MSRILWTPWTKQPIWHAIIAWLLTALYVSLGVGDDGTRGCAGTLFGVFLVLSLIFLLIYILVAVSTYPIAERYLARLVLLFLSLILIFANFYFLMLAIPTRSPFEGLHSPWVWLPGTQGRRLYWSNAGQAAVDCFHFSVVTATTLGFGDMRPVHWFAKLVTDLEVLLGAGIVVIGFGRLFSQSGRPRV